MGADVCRTSSRASRRPPDVTCGAAILDQRWRRRKWRQPRPGAAFSTPIEEWGARWRPFRFRRPSWMTSFAEPRMRSSKMAAGSGRAAILLLTPQWGSKRPPYTTKMATSFLVHVHSQLLILAKRTNNRFGNIDGHLHFIDGYREGLIAFLISFNTLTACDTYMNKLTGSSMVQIRACRISTSKHYKKQCLTIVTRIFNVKLIFGNKFQRKVNQHITVYLK